MKLLTAAFWLLITAFTYVSAQVPITVNEETKSMSKGMHNAFTVEVPQYKISDLKKEWGKYIKKKSKSKTSVSKTEWSMPNGKIDALTFDTISVHTVFAETSAGISVASFFAVKDSFVTTANNPLVATKIKKMMFEFAKAAYIKTVEKELDKEKRAANVMKDGHERLMKDEDKALESIAESNHKIEENKTELDASKDELELKQKEIFNQKQKALAMDRKSEERKKQNKIVQGMEKDKKYHIKSQQTLAKEIANHGTNVRTKERYIAGLKEEQKKKGAEIMKQLDAVAAIESKLDSIRKMYLPEISK